MANINNNSPRKTHVSPGIYTSETELNYASKSLGITTLGVVGETLRGPAFQAIPIEDWRQFKQYFGGTSTEKYRGSQYPKYELPYIAQSYLKRSNQLKVVRVLGLSGVNAGPAWFVTASKKTADSDYTHTLVAVIRSRGEHRKAAFIRTATDEDRKEGVCNDIYEYDNITYYASDVRVQRSDSLVINGACDKDFKTDEGAFDINSDNYGRFTFVVTTNTGAVKKYSVSLNPGESNYIYNVIGGDPEKGDAEIYVEEVYDVALRQLIERGEIDQIDHYEFGTKVDEANSKAEADGDRTLWDIVKFDQVYVVPKFNAVNGLLTKDEDTLTRSDLGKRFLYGSVSVNSKTGDKLKVHQYKSPFTGTPSVVDGQNGHIYTVAAYTTQEGTREYYYMEYLDEKGEDSTIKNFETEYLTTKREFVNDNGYVDEDKSRNRVFENAVLNLEDGQTYILGKFDEGDDIVPIKFDVNDYKEEFRYSSTPWVVSEMKGSANDVELSRLFRFHTISDGSTSATEVKVSIESIDPARGTFDVVVRNFADTDSAVQVLESFRGVNLTPGDKNYISYRIGSFDGAYAGVSKLITVEVNENERTKVSYPAGFLGYPVREYFHDANSVNYVDKDDNKHEANEILKPYLQYNTNVDEDIRIRKQYFGMSDLVGIDEDVLKYKGAQCYSEEPETLTPCFHLDSRILEGVPDPDDNYNVTQYGVKQRVTVDGVVGYQWVTVGKNNVTLMGEEPRFGTEEIMLNTIYEDKRYRKFTMCFYGGWDGWDYYRDQRSNGDDYRYTKYRGRLNKTSGQGTMTSVIKDPENYGFEEGAKVLTTDYYAYKYGYNQFANPKAIDINVFATPGIDYVNQKSLVDEVIEMIDEERADSIYVVTTPDKPNGAGDLPSEMFTPSNAVINLEDSEIDSNYTCTYYPWVQYFDYDNSQYIFLPPTRDVVANFAYTDNTKYPWFAAAGWYRGNLDTNAEQARKILKIGEQDVLYENRINFINNFGDDDRDNQMKIWGDKNLQVHESPMNRISKRRLLLRVRKLCSIACIGLVFDPNDNTTKKSFESAVTPVMNDVMSKRGIHRWSIEIDDSQEARDRLELPARLILQPTPLLEYISIEFAITPNGSVWGDV